MNKKQFALFVKSTVEQLKYMHECEKDARFSRKTSPTQFEKLVVEATRKIINKNNYKCAIDYTEDGHAFPDIVFSFKDVKFGIEVKSSTSANFPDNCWTILGNSILGSTRIDVEEVHIIYIKINKNGCFIDHAKYEDAVSDIVVTHSPRYKINLAQDPKDSFFAKSGISYKQIKESDDPK